jgi:serine/threonine protein kinase
VQSVSSHGPGDTTVSEDTPALDDFLVVGRFDPDGPTAETFAPFPGEQIGRYLLVDKLAQGNFGFVFSARDIELDREVALKVLNPDHANKREIVRRFLQEASATARVVHPGVVTVLDCGQYNGGAYIAMDLLDGESLTQRLENCGRLLPHDAVEVARQIAAALEAAHAAGVLHRDLKPDNIFVVTDPAMPDGLRIKILDFGLAKVIDESGIHQRTSTRVHSVFGTPRYMSPEQCRSSTSIDHRADIYSLGCILFELVTGTPPFDGDIEQVIEAHLVGTIPRASMLSGCTPQLDELITQLMAKDPARRPPSMTAVRRALDKLPLGRLGSAPLTPPPQRTPLPSPSAASMIATTPKLPALKPAVAKRPIPSILPPRPVVPPSNRIARIAVVQPTPALPVPPKPARIVSPGSTRTPRILQGMLSVPTAPGVTSLSKPPRPNAADASPPPYVAPSNTPSVIANEYVMPGSGPHRRRSTTDSAPAQPALPPYFAKPPTISTSPYAPTPYGGSPVAAPLPPLAPSWPRAASAVALPAPAFVASSHAGRHPMLPEAPSMSTAMAMSMAYVPTGTSARALSLSSPIAVPVGLAAPADSMFGVANLDPPPASKLPLIALAIACVLSGVLAALVLV